MVERILENVSTFLASKSDVRFYSITFELHTVRRSYRHEVYTDEVNKVALCPIDDKRYILEDGVHTLALGHYSI